MNFSKQAEKKFEIVATDDPGLVGFKVALNTEFLVPSAVPAFVSTYANFVGRNPRRADWDAYVYVRTEEANDETWFHFIPSLPSTVKTTQRVDEIWGLVTVYEYLQNTTSIALPDVASNLTSYDPINTAGYTLKAEETPIAKGLSKFVVERSAVDLVTVSEDEIDQETGTKIDVDKAYRLTASTTIGASVDSTGLATEAVRLSHNIWLQTSKKIIGGLGVGIANAKVWTSHEKMYWPPVASDFELTTVVNDVTDPQFFKRLLSYRMREAFTGEVVVTNSLYWDLLEATTTGTASISDTMIPCGIDADGNLMEIHVRECLHPAFFYEEQNFVADFDEDGYVINREMVMIEFDFAATNVTDWPATVTRYKKEYFKGGFKVLKQVYARPADYASGQLTVSQRGWFPSDGYWYALA